MKTLSIELFDCYLVLLERSPASRLRQDQLEEHAPQEERGGEFLSIAGVATRARRDARKLPQDEESPRAGMTSVCRYGGLS